VVKIGRRRLAIRCLSEPARYVLSMSEQGFVSALNLATNVWLIRSLSETDYGLFVLVTNSVLIFNNLQGSMTTVHLMTLPPGLPSRTERLKPERVIFSLTLLTITMAFLGCLIVVAIFNRNAAIIPVAASIYLPTIMLNSYTRSLAFSRGLIKTGTVQSGAVLLISLVLWGISYVGAYTLTVNRALLLLSSAYGGAGLATLWWLCRSMFGELRLRDIHGFRDYLRESLWIFLGIGSIELLGRFNSVIVGIWFNTAAVGTLGATQLLLRPIGMIISSLSVIGRMRMVERREANDWDGFVRIVVQGIGGALVISVPWVLTIYFAWPLISSHLFSGQYASDGWIVLLSGLSAIAGVVLFVVSLAFQALRRFRLLAYTDMVGAVVSVAVTMILVTLHYSFAFSLVGMMTGQVLDLILLGWFLSRLKPRIRVMRSGT
jgi:O-antigen/teichoic acid export membrane protein